VCVCVYGSHARSWLPHQNSPLAELLLDAGSVIGQPWTPYRPISQRAFDPYDSHHELQWAFHLAFWVRWLARPARPVRRSNLRRELLAPPQLLVVLLPLQHRLAHWLLAICSPTCLGRDLIPARSSSARYFSVPRRSVSKEVECLIC